MKFTQLPKKLLLSGMSAAMVVAFAPNLALAAVDSNSGSNTKTDPSPTYSEVAELTYVDVATGKTTTTQKFTSSDTRTDDDALQAAISAAALVDQSKYKDVKVTLLKDIQTVSNVTGQDGANEKYYYSTGNTHPYKDNANAGLVATGTGYTIDLGGHSLANTTIAKDSDGNVKTGLDATNETPVLTIESANLATANSEQQVTETFYATSLADAKAGNVVNAKNEQQTLEGIDGDKTSTKSPTKYYWNSSLETFQTEKIDGATPYYQFDVNYTKSVAGKTESKDAGTVTVTNGTLSSGTFQNAINVRDGGNLVLDGATVTSTKAKAAIQNFGSGTVTLEGGAKVEASLNGYIDYNENGTYDSGTDRVSSVYGILSYGNNGTVKVAQTGAQQKAKADASENNATVTATLTNGLGEKVASAYGIRTWKFEANTGATVTASASAGSTAATDAGKSYTIVDPWTGEEKTVSGSTGSPSQPQVVLPSSAVVAMDSATVKYGVYTGDYALGAQDSNGYTYGAAPTVYAGTYNGYVANYGTVYGGKFKYAPDQQYKHDTDANGKTTTVIDQNENTVAQGVNSGKRAVEQNSADGYYYVYRVGTAAVNKVDTNAKGEIITNSSSMIDLAAPSDAKNAKGKAYTASNYSTAEDALNAYVQDKYLNAATKAKVFASDEVGAALNDGNKDSEGNMNLELDATYAGPNNQLLRDTYADAWKVADQLKTDSSQSEQGLYALEAKQTYNYNAKKKAYAYSENLSSLGDATVALTAHAVTADANPRAYKVADGAATEVATTPGTYVATGPSGTATWTADTGVYALMYTASSDLIAQQKAQADAAAAKAVSDAIAALPTTVTADNVTSASNAVAAAQAAYTGLTADQKALVTNKDALDAAQKAVDDYVASAQKAAEEAAQKAADEKTEAAQKAAAEAQEKAEAAQKAAEEAKASYEAAQAKLTAQNQKVKGLKVKAAKKKATVSWKKASGYKYQLKYRQKNSAKTADFKYKKTSKTKVTVKSLKSGKYYNFKVRTYKKVNGKTVYGKWTSIVTAKIK